MWIATKNGFLSIVRNANFEHAQEEMLVRSRVRSDIEFFAAQVLQPGRAHVRCTPEADYPFRIFCSRSAVAMFLADQVSGIEYTNFKEEVARTDERRARVYTHVWAALHGLREQSAQRGVPE